MVMMMQATEMRLADDATGSGGLDSARNRRVPIQREMGSRFMVVAEVRRQNAP